MESFIMKGQAELKSFYGPYFNTETELETFLFDALDYENGLLARRQMLYQVQRFVSLADDIDQLRPGRDCLRMLFIRICLESLYSLSNNSNNKKMFFNNFADYFSDAGKQYILGNFRLLSFEDEFCGHIFEASHELTLMDFLEILKVARDQVVHEGVYWDKQFFAHDDDSHWLTSIETKENMLVTYNYQRKQKKNVTYHFETTMNYNKFVYYFVEACVNYIQGINVD